MIVSVMYRWRWLKQSKNNSWVSGPRKLVILLQCPQERADPVRDLRTGRFLR